MSLLDTVVNVQISLAAATPALPNFGTQAIHAYHTAWADRIRTYFDAADMLTDGFTEDSPAYLAALRIVSQNPRPESFKVIRGSTAVAYGATIVVLDAVVGKRYGVTMLSPLGVSTDCHYVAVGGDTTSTIASAVSALLAALPDSTSTPTGASIAFAGSTAGLIWYPSDFAGVSYLDTTGDASVSADLADALNYDTSWYGVVPTIQSAVNILNAAVWVEANKKLMAYESADTNNLTAGTGIFNTLKVASYTRSVGLFTRTPSEYGAAGWMAQRFTDDPGSDTWAYKQIAGRTRDVLTPNEQTNITTNNGNFYVDISDSVPVTMDGRAASGLFVDFTRGADALAASMQNRIATLLIRLKKLAYTTRGIAAVGTEVEAALKEFIATGFISDDIGFQYQVSLPALKNVSPSDKATRTLRNVKFSAVAQGAIHKVRVQGIVTI